VLGTVKDAARRSRGGRRPSLTPPARGALAPARSGRRDGGGCLVALVIGIVEDAALEQGAGEAMVALGKSTRQRQSTTSAKMVQVRCLSADGSFPYLAPTSPARVVYPERRLRRRTARPSPPQDAGGEGLMLTVTRCSPACGCVSWRLWSEPRLPPRCPRAPAHNQRSHPPGDAEAGSEPRAYSWRSMEAASRFRQRSPVLAQAGARG
jgi:hypothetical protein